MSTQPIHEAMQEANPTVPTGVTEPTVVPEPAPAAADLPDDEDDSWGGWTAEGWESQGWSSEGWTSEGWESQGWSSEGWTVPQPAKPNRRSLIAEALATAAPAIPLPPAHRKLCSA